MAAKTTDRTYMFEEMPIPNAVVNLCVPTIISSLVMMLYSLVDTYFVGLLNDPLQTAAVTLAGPVLLAFNAINNLFGVGSSSMMSRALGRKDTEAVSKSSATGFYSALFCAAMISICCTAFKTPLLTLLGASGDTLTTTSNYMFWTVTCGAIPAILNVLLAYMVRSEGAALHASLGTMSGCILNMILDPIMILPWGLGMGAAGAGLATFISNCFACAYFLVLILVIKRGKTYVCLNPAKISYNKEIFLGICIVGVPAAIQNLLNVTGMTILNNFTAAFGADAVSAMGISQKINMVPMYVAMGTSQGIMPLVSYNFSSGNSKRMKKAVYFTMAISQAFLLVMVVVLYCGAGPIISTFMKNEAVVMYGSRFLRSFCFGLPFIAMDFLAVGVFQACGMGKEALIFAIMRKVLLEIPALFILNHFFPLYGLPFAQPCAEFILAIAAILVLRKLFASLNEKTDVNDL